jgi:fructoselysine-6-P-deglycase FrlB-like protein
MTARSRYEANILAQPALVRAALSAPAPAWMKPPKKGRKAFFVGVGTNHHAARIAAWLWSQAGIDARAAHSHDFVARPYRLSRGDLAVFLSHRGSKSYTVQAEKAARRAGAETVIVTCAGSPWKSPRRIVTGPIEDTGTFTQSFTTTMAWLLRWPRKASLVAPFKTIDKSLRWGPAFPAVTRGVDLVLLGDGLREWVAAETALKVQEAAYLRARSFGLEEFLHGPRLSVGEGSLVIGFASRKEPRWRAARRYLKAIDVPFVEVASEDWLAQVLWGQRFALDACRRLRIDPDVIRAGDPRYARALKAG